MAQFIPVFHDRQHYHIKFGFAQIDFMSER